MDGEVPWSSVVTFRIAAAEGVLWMCVRGEGRASSVAGELKLGSVSPPFGKPARTIREQREGNITSERPPERERIEGFNLLERYLLRTILLGSVLVEQPRTSVCFFFPISWVVIGTCG